MDNKKDLDLFPELMESAYQKGFRMGGFLTGVFNDKAKNDS